MMNESVTLGENHAYTEWGIVMTGAEIQPPEVEMVNVSVPGRDGDIDITDNLYGRTPYKNRTIAMHFKAPDEDTWAAKYSSILENVHGQTLDIIFDSDPEWYYTGRCIVSGFERGDRLITFDIEVNADPYKYNLEDPTLSIL